MDNAAGRNRLDHRWPVTSDIPQGSRLAQTPFNVFINNHDDEVVTSLTRFVDDIKFGGVVNSPEGKATLQRAQEKWATGILRRPIGENSVLFPERNNPMQH